MSEITSPTPTTSLQSRSILITGGASGLGEATAIEFAQHGAYITITDISIEAGQALAAKLGPRTTFVHCDTTNWDSCTAAFRHCAAFSPSKSVDVVILFAGGGGENENLVDTALRNPDLTSAPKTTALDVNLYGVWNCAYLALHYFSRQKDQDFRNSLVFVSSIFGYQDGPNTGYLASKFGVRGMFRSLRAHVGRVRVRVNNVAPGYVLTPATRAGLKIGDPGAPSAVTGKVYPWARFEDVVRAVGLAAVDEEVDGRTLGVFPSGVYDMLEDHEAGYGGIKWATMLDYEGYTDLV